MVSPTNHHHMTGKNVSLEKMHQITPPFTPNIPQNSSYSIQTQTHYSVAPVSVDPYAVIPPPVKRRGSITKYPPRISMADSFSTVCLSTTPVGSSSSNGSSFNAKFADTEGRCCTCCGLFV